MAYEVIPDWGDREGVRVHFAKNFPFVDKWYLCSGDHCESGVKWQEAWNFVKQSVKDHGGFSTNGGPGGQASFGLEGSYVRRRVRFSA